MTTVTIQPAPAKSALDCLHKECLYITVPQVLESVVLIEMGRLYTIDEIEPHIDEAIPTVLFKVTGNIWTDAVNDILAKLEKLGVPFIAEAYCPDNEEFNRLIHYVDGDTFRIYTQSSNDPNMCCYYIESLLKDGKVEQLLAETQAFIAKAQDYEFSKADEAQAKRAALKALLIQEESHG